ncbi:MAG: ATP-grasp domain-containing protein [Bacteroidetes bacterium]|nr:MAG: ATP-grasp domain-containing protein [Bacteroidota bacterium]
MKSSILVFGAGDNQLDLIKACRKLGYRTIVTDPAESPPGAKWADLFFVLSADDIIGHEEVIIKEKVKGIVTCQMENPLELMALLAQKFNMPFPSPKAIKKARNKFLMKEAFVSGEVPCAFGILFRNYEQASNSNLTHRDFPLIMKPIDSHSSKGVIKVDSKKELLANFKVTSSFSSNGEVLVESFLSGPEVSVEALTFKGQTTIVQVTDKWITPYPHTVELQHIQPSSLPKDTIVKIHAIVKKAVKVLGLDNCGIHAELKITDQGPKMIEIAARLGGDYISSWLTLLSTGINMNKALAQIAMGQHPDLEQHFSWHSAIRYVNWPSGKKVAKITSLKPFLNDHRVNHAGIFLKQGQLTPLVCESKSRHSFFITSANNRQQLMKHIKALTKKMHAVIRLKKPKQEVLES